MKNFNVLCLIVSLVTIIFRIPWILMWLWSFLESYEVWWSLQSPTKSWKSDQVSRSPLKSREVPCYLWNFVKSVEVFLKCFEVSQKFEVSVIEVSWSLSRSFEVFPSLSKSFEVSQKFEVSVIEVSWSLLKSFEVCRFPLGIDVNDPYVAWTFFISSLIGDI